MKQYEPELGQSIFGQPFKEYEVPEYVWDALKVIRNTFDEIYGDKEDSITYWRENPFNNSAGDFKNDAFEVEAYSWNDEYEQPYNFKYNDIEISWYKYLGRGMSSNREISNKETNKMLVECLRSLE